MREDPLDDDVVYDEDVERERERERESDVSDVSDVLDEDEVERERERECERALRRRAASPDRRGDREREARRYE